MTLALTDLERTGAIRWVDVSASPLRPPDALALLDPVCASELTPRIARDLVTPAQFPAGRDYAGGRVTIAAAFRVRHLDGPANGGSPRARTSVFEPLHLLRGRDWLVTCWLPPRVFRGDASRVDHDLETSVHLLAAVGEAWPQSGARSAGQLADLVRRELAVACGYRSADP